MKAVVLDYETRTLRAAEIAPPGEPGPGEVLLQIDAVGVCGTDRELAEFRLGFAPEGETVMVLGHEAAATVVATGRGVTEFRAGDRVVPRVRHACSLPCRPCGRGRSDLCVTGQFRECGIFGRHGFFRRLAVEPADGLVAVPAALDEFAVLTEPLSVVEKAVETALRLREEPAQTALVLGAGTIGLLAALAFRTRGLLVTVHSLEAATHPRARLAERAGAEYRTTLEGVRADIVLEATGSAEAAFAGIAAMGPLGVCGVLGASLGRSLLSFVDLVVQNQRVFGSVNASPQSFADAVADLARFDPAVLRALVRRAAFDDWPETVTQPNPEVAKVVHVLH